MKEWLPTPPRRFPNRALSGFLARLQDRRVAFVTGATSGFGAAITRRFLENGFQVVALGRRAERLSQLQNDYDKNRVHTLTLDITDRASVEAAVADLPQEFQSVECLVNN